MSGNTDHPTFKAIVKWRNHPSTFTITSEHENTPNFPLVLFQKNMFLKKYKCWIPQKLSQKAIFLLIKGNSDLFVEIICQYFNESLEKSVFFNRLKLENITPVFKS